MEKRPELRVWIGFAGEDTQEYEMGWSVQGAVSSLLFLELKIQGWEKKLKWQSASPLECPMTFCGGPRSPENEGSRVCASGCVVDVPVAAAGRMIGENVTGLQ